MRIWAAIGTLFVFGTVLCGQTALSNSEAILVKTCLGTTQPTSSPVVVSGAVVIAVFGDTLREDELAKVRQEITSFYQASRLNSLRLAVIYGSEIQFVGPFRTRALLEAGLTELLHAAPPAGETAPLRFYSYLGNLASQFGSGWSSLVLVGRFPAADAELTSYSAAWLSTQFRTAKVRVSYWTPSGESTGILDSVVPGTGGLRLAEGMAQMIPALKETGNLREISWSDPHPADGFQVCPLTLVGANGQTLMTVPSIAAAAGAAAPELDRYAQLREKIKSLRATLGTAQISADQTKQAEADLKLALEIDPREEEALHLGASLYERTGNDAKLTALLDTLAANAPNDASVWIELGHSRFRMKDWEAAERALSRARELKPGDALVAEELARIRLARQDDRGALPLLEESLAANAGNQELWLLRADAAARLDDWQQTADSVEHAISLGGVPFPRRTALVRLYLDHQMKDRALIQVRAMAGNLPADSAARAEYAGFLDQLNQPDEALAAWKRALEVDSKLEPAHYRVARLLIGKGAFDEALAACEAGLDGAPQSARLYLAKAEVLEKKGRYYEARRSLREIAATLPDAALLERLAEMEDAGGEHAARYYRKLVETGNQSPELLARGLGAALRDGDAEDAAWFQARQTGGGGGGGTARARGATVSIPGGLAALSFIARSRPSSPERFLVEYARSSARSLQAADKKTAEAYTESIREHFRRVAELSALGSSKGGQVTVTIAAQDKKNQKSAEKVLDLLGWKMHSSKQRGATGGGREGRARQAIRRRHRRWPLTKSECRRPSRPASLSPSKFPRNPSA